MGSLKNTLSAVRRLKPNRWWPVLMVLALVAARLVHVWFFHDYARQFKLRNTYAAFKYGGLLLVAYAGLLLAAWLLRRAWQRWRFGLLWRVAVVMLIGTAAYWIYRHNATALRSVTGLKVSLWAGEPMLANP